MIYKKISIFSAILTILVGTLACSSTPSPTALAPDSATAAATTTAQPATVTNPNLVDLKQNLASPTPPPPVPPRGPNGLNTIQPTPTPPGGLVGEIWEPTCPEGMTMVALEKYGPDQAGEFSRIYRCEQVVECDSPEFAMEVSSATVTEVFVDQGKKQYTFILECNVTNIFPEG